jgi:hypothetical protein
VTSTTSKKPGDISEERPEGQSVRVYEVTTKIFGESRVNDSLETVVAFMEETGEEISEVLVLCRREDLHPDAIREENGSVFIGTLHRGAISYRFIEIFGWIEAQLLRMTPTARAAFFEQLASYIVEPDTAERVKRRWMQLMNG